jgi:amino acid permease
LTARDLTVLESLLLGAGIFSTIGKASADGGPAVIFFIYLLQSHAVLHCLC